MTCHSEAGIAFDSALHSKGGTSSSHLGQAMMPSPRRRTPPRIGDGPNMVRDFQRAMKGKHTPKNPPTQIKAQLAQNNLEQFVQSVPLFALK